MKKLLLLLLLFSHFTEAQNLLEKKRQCSSNDNLNIFLENNPRYKDSLIKYESKIKTWIELNNRRIKELNYTEQTKKTTSNNQRNRMLSDGVCGYDNEYFSEINAPTSLNQTVSPAPNCVFGGEYVRVIGLIAGNTYRISTIGQQSFDTVISIYNENGSEIVAFNDDFNGSLQSEIYFTPFVSGNYNILIDEIGCIDNNICSILEVDLWSEPRPIITIPVVVHVIHNGEEIGIGSNISEEQIISQIFALNEDFRRSNNELNNTNPAFKGSSADPLIEFCLAQRAPDGGQTNGINRFEIQTILNELISEGLPDDLQCLNKLTMELLKVYTIWDRNSYLNIWVSDSLWENSNELPGCDIAANTLGYAQFPGMGGPLSEPDGLLDPASTDGVWVRNDVFGTTGNLDNTFNLGKTATHEVGHWLNLKHIWGDVNDCSMDDLVIDTPIQQEPTYGCGSFPQTDDCSEFFPGIMFNNFMDYGDDICLSMFTFGQTARIDASLFTTRISLLSSLGCESSSLNDNDLYINEKIKIYPNPTSDFINIELQAFNANKVVITNLIGQKIIEMDITGEQTKKIDISSLNNGIYILSLKNKDNRNVTIKILKKN